MVSKNLKTLRRRILDISKRNKLSHIGSNLSILPVLTEIYEKKRPSDLVILGGAHAHLAHLAVKEKYEGLKNIEKIVENWGIHCDRKAGCDASGGSLGHAIGIAIGRALANPHRHVYVIVTDGDMQEGANWEALRIIDDLALYKNLHIYTNFNGYSAVAKIDLYTLEQRMKWFCLYINFRRTNNGEGFDGIAGHYKIL